MPTADDRSTPAPSVQSGIYQIRHKASGKIYVGSAAHLRKRWDRHRYELNRGIHYNPRLQRAWNKYGAEAFVFEVLEIVADIDDLLRIEQAHIDRKHPFDPRLGYNISLAADCPTRGRKHSAETRAKISAAQKGRPLTEAQQAAIQSPERKAKIAAARRGATLKPESRAKVAEAMRRRMADPDERERIASKTRGQQRDEQHRAKMSAILSVRMADPETRRKMSESAKKRCERERLGRDKAQALLPFPD